MKKQDILFILFLISIFLPFFLSKDLYQFYIEFNKEYGFVAGFIKFFVLAPIGELIGLRIRTGKYLKKNFGILPRAIVWGFIGITIVFAFKLFAISTPIILEYIGLENSVNSMKNVDVFDSFANNLGIERIITAFSISVALNLIYAPVLMTLHKITDTHIASNSGKLNSLIKKINVANILTNIDWNIHWGFILKKTIVLFWIPAQTITFLIAEDFRVLLAALYGIILGVLLAFAANKK